MGARRFGRQGFRYLGKNKTVSINLGRVVPETVECRFLSLSLAPSPFGDISNGTIQVHSIEPFLKISDRLIAAT